jgi:hypothetical protein
MREPKRKKLQLDYGRIDPIRNESIGDFAKRLTEFARHYPNAIITTDYDYADETEHYKAYEERLETDEELEIRKAAFWENLLQRELKDAEKIEKVKQKKELDRLKKEQEEKALLAKLQKKYGGK